jgi:hypothetical protein
VAGGVALLGGGFTACFFEQFTRKRCSSASGHRPFVTLIICAASAKQLRASSACPGLA